MADAIKIENLTDMKQGKMFRSIINDRVILLANIYSVKLANTGKTSDNKAAI